MVKSSFKYKIPNILTILRIALVPFVIVFLLVDFGPNIYTINFDNPINQQIVLKLNFLLSAILFILSCFTDYLDGFLARKWKCVSNFGKFWDPIADKILINSTLFCLSSKGLVPIWIPIILLIRDIIMDGIRINALKKDVIIPANIWGKLKTIIQMVAIIFVYFFSIPESANYELWYWLVQNFWLYIAILFSLISLIIYTLQYFKKVKTLENDKKI